MKLTIAILALIVFALSLWADYRWRQWMKNRRSSSNPDHPGAARADSEKPR